MSLRARWWQRTIGARIIVLFLGLLLAVQLASVTALHASLSAHAQRKLPVQLEAGHRVLRHLLDRRSQALVDGARLLAADYGFREALASNDTDTIASVLANHGARIGATEAALLTTDFRLRATTTAHAADLAPLAARLSAQVATTATAQASTVAPLDGRPYQAVLVPVKAPLTVGWVLMAFPLDARLVADLRSMSGMDLTVLARVAPGAPWRTSLSSLDGTRADTLARQDWQAPGRTETMVSVDDHDEDLAVRAQALSQAGDVLALVSLSEDEAVRAPRDLQWALVAITAVGILVFAFGSVVTARRVTTPLRELANAAERLGAGDFETPMRKLQRQDEIGELAQSFERMRTRVAEHQAQVLQLAYWDNLTGLPNRAQFRDVVGQAVQQATPGAPVAVLMLDLDRFKHVNDVLGYRIGDLLLVGVAQRLSSQVVREGDVVARLGGDEFGILLRGSDAAQAATVAQRIEQAFDVPLALEEHQVDLHAGIGIACWPRDAADGESLLNRAEVAMYAAKRRSTGPLAYDPTIDLASAQSLTLMTELRQAVDRHELLLMLQPKLALRTGQVVGAEALVRWRHPQRGLVPPMQFIPFAEQTGFIRVLTLWVVEEAARHWQTLNDEGLALRLSVNLSARDLMDPDLPQKFEALLARHAAPASAFCLEITESAIMEDPQRAVGTLDRLSALGFMLSIDDFGTGYSSLAYLKRLPVHELKIDQSFVRNMQGDASDAVIVRSTIDLAHNLGLKVVAEGVENAEVWDLLGALDCDEAQGFHMGRPMPVEAFPAWSEGWLAGRPVAIAGDGRRLH